MACCKAGHEHLDNWCKDEPIVHTGSAGKEYCVFHAPVGKKKCSKTKFDNQLAERITQHLEAETECDLSGTIFEWNIKIEDLPSHNSPTIKLPAMNLSYTHFKGNADFFFTFFGDANFIKAHFWKEVFFGHAHFKKSAIFTEAEFENKVNFSRTKFKEGADFSNAVFSSDVFFYHANFYDGNNNYEADFSDANFKGNAHFYESRFLGDADFTGAQFFKEADFIQSRFSGDAVFSYSKFKGEVKYSRSAYKGIAFFVNTRFEQETSFKETFFNNEADFSATHFEKVAYFSAMLEQNTDKKYYIDIPIGYNLFNGIARFKNIIIINALRLEKANLKKASFIDTDVRQIEFLNCVWPEESGQRILHDHSQLSKPLPKEQHIDLIKKVEILYRRLKQKAKESHDEAEASLWHYGEKEMQRQRGGPGGFFSWVIINLYCAFSGYAERPVRAFYFFIGLIFFFALLLAWTKDGTGHGLGELLLSTLQYATFEKTPEIVPKETWGMVVKLGAKLLIPLQAALMALAIRNRFRR